VDRDVEAFAEIMLNTVLYVVSLLGVCNYGGPFKTPVPIYDATALEVAFKDDKFSLQPRRHVELAKSQHLMSQ
jgi:hypothetical protein